jgi:hypothetical protein
MILIEDNGLYWYVNPLFPEQHNMLSPVFNDSALALQWRGRVGHENFGDIEELQTKLTALQNGTEVVLPSSKGHAEAMLRVASFYLDNLK